MRVSKEDQMMNQEKTYQGGKEGNTSGEEVKSGSEIWT